MVGITGATKTGLLNGSALLTTKQQMNGKVEKLGLITELRGHHLNQL
jgi:hypothetical protein